MISEDFGRSESLRKSQPAARTKATDAYFANLDEKSSARVEALLGEDQASDDDQQSNEAEDGLNIWSKLW
jgi:hypothetical protein